MRAHAAEGWGSGQEVAAGRAASHWPFAEWSGVQGSERLTGALLDRLTHHVHILERNGESYRLKTSKERRAPDRAK